MPPREYTSRPPRTSVYSILLVVSAAFLALAVLITFSELKSDYDFMGTATGMAAEEVIEEEAAPAEEAPAAEEAAPATEDGGAAP